MGYLRWARCQVDITSAPHDDGGNHITRAGAIVIEKAKDLIVGESKAEFLVELSQRCVDDSLTRIESPAREGPLPGVIVQTTGASTQQERSTAADAVDSPVEPRLHVGHDRHVNRRRINGVGAIAFCVAIDNYQSDRCVLRSVEWFSPSLVGSQIRNHKRA